MDGRKSGQDEGKRDRTVWKEIGSPKLTRASTFKISYFSALIRENIYVIRFIAREHFKFYWIKIDLCSFQHSQYLAVAAVGRSWTIGSSHGRHSTQLPTNNVLIIITCGRDIVEFFYAQSLHSLWLLIN